MADKKHTIDHPDPRTKDLNDQRFGNLVAIEYLGTRQGRSFWKCRCDCGVIVEKPAKQLLRKQPVESCGCAYRTLGISAQKRQENWAIYRIFKHMWGRCTNPTDARFAAYGGRGITVDARWKIFDVFLADMGPRPTPRHSIDRIDNDGPYSKENCRWASARMQANNTRRNQVITFNNETMTLAEWSRKIGKPANTLLMRLRHGWTIADTLLTPVLDHHEAASKVFLTWNNETHSLIQWAVITGLSRTTLAYRLHHGWTVEEIFMTPVGKQGKR